MKTKATLIALALLLTLNLKAQWTKCKEGVDYFVWRSLVYNGNLYVCGNFENADGKPALGIAKWNGSDWSDVGGGFMHGAFTNVVRGLAIFNGDLIAGGYVDSAGGVPIHKVAKWNGTAWSAMGTDCAINTINCFAIHNGELYAGGEASGAVKSCVAKWTGSSWTNLTGAGGNSVVNSMVSYNGELYAGGNFIDINGVSAKGLAKWNGTAWSAVGTGFAGTVNAVAVFNSKLFIGGTFATAGGVTVNNITSWDGTTWTALKTGVNASVQCLLPHGNKLFVGGTYWMVDGVEANRAAYWDGSAWTVLGTDLGSGARTMAVYNNELYSAGEGASNNQKFVAKWTGGTFTTTGLHEAGSVQQTNISVYPNPVTDRLYVSGTSAQGMYIIDCSGRTIAVEVIVRKGEAAASIDVSTLSAGLYFLCNNEGLRHKFVVQRGWGQ